MSHPAGLSRLHERAPGQRVASHGASSHAGRMRGERGHALWDRPEPPPPAVAARQVVRAEEIRFRRLSSAEEIACVLPLRREISLHVPDPAGFAILEKKETSAALSAPSSGADNSLVPSASFRSAMALRLVKRSLVNRAYRPKCKSTAGK